MSRNKKIGLALAIALIFSIANFSWQVYSAYQIWSNQVPVNVSAKATLSLAANATDAFVGDTIQLTAHLSDNLDGVSVTFFENNVEVGSATTAAGGYAVFNQVLGSAGAKVYNATCMHT